MKQTVLGKIKSQPEMLKYTLDNQIEFVDPFVEVFKKHDIKKVFFFGSGTSYNVSQIAAYYFKHIVGIDASAQYPTVYQNYEKPDWTGMLKNDQIRLLWFIHPIMINEWNMENCILFANEVNRELGNGGRFWVDTEYFDFAYEERFEEEMLQLSGMNVLERHMFEWPLGQFRDIHIPLMMLLQGKWGAETAIRFIKELRENGFVENEKYDLFPDA